MAVDIQRIPSPAFVLEEPLLRRNLELIRRVQEEAGVSIILAFKGFAMWSAFPIVREYLPGATASSLNEARLCYEEMGVRAHSYSPAYLPEEFEQMLQLSSHLTFNSLSQFRRFEEQVKAYAGRVSCGLRVNPEYSVVETALYNPCAPGSRLGELAENLPRALPKAIEGLHFHTLCESSSKDLGDTLKAFEERFAHWLPQMKWVNMGGGHLMTRKGYDVEHLIALLQDFRQRHQLQVILESGSAIAWETGFLLATILDIVENKNIRTAIVDVSFTAHMPDTLEMPYRPAIRGARDNQEGPHRYRIGGMSCLAGDFMYEYSFDQELAVGDRLIFEDMIHYTMVKTTMFNGVKHPAIAIWTQEDQLKVVREFGYEDFKGRLS
ncbi:MAG: carboxynorspermidine decarboxylase [Bacteroidota bacterium]